MSSFNPTSNAQLFQVKELEDHHFENLPLVHFSFANVTYKLTKILKCG